MKKNNNLYRLISFLMAFLLMVSSMDISVFAMEKSFDSKESEKKILEADDEIKSISTESYFEINPIFEDVISDSYAEELKEEFLDRIEKYSESNSLSLEEDDSITLESDEYTDIESAAMELRREMKKKK